MLKSMDLYIKIACVFQILCIHIFSKVALYWRYMYTLTIYIVYRVRTLGFQQICQEWI